MTRLKKHGGWVLGLMLITSVALAAYTVRGTYEGIGFTVNFEPQRMATVRWDDGHPGFTGYYNPSPNPAPRCPCEVYENGRRRVTVERQIGGGYLRAYFSMD